MASFQNMVITTAGLELLQDLILEGGTPLTFSGVGVGDGLLEDSDITARTSLVHEVHRLPIEKIEKQEGGHIRVFARLATDIITTDFYHRELGVFARYGEQEILFAYGNAGDDYDFIPATGNNASICKTIVTEFTVGSMKAVFLPLDSKDFVTHEAMNAQVEEVITRETRKVLEAIPQVDAAGNMTLPGGLTAAGAINANGGINIPQAVGAPTDTGAVNRLYASGLAAVTEAFSPQSFLSDFNLYGESVAVEQTVPGQVWRLRKMSADPGTIQINLINPFLGVSNYSGWHGFVLPVALGNTGSTSARKLTFALGKPGNVVKKTAAEMDMFTLSPVSGSTASFPRFIDVTFYMVNDTSMNPAGYPVRVRELVYDSAQAKWLCYETLSVFPSTNTNPSCNMFLSYQQDRTGRDVRAGLWIGSNAADSRRLLCIADMHGVVDTYSWTGVGALYWDSDGTNSHSYLGAMRQMTAPGYSQPNGAYAAFRALETRLIQSTSTYDFTPYE